MRRTSVADFPHRPCHPDLIANTPKGYAMVKIDGDRMLSTGRLDCGGSSRGLLRPSSLMIASCGLHRGRSGCDPSHPGGAALAPSSPCAGDPWVSGRTVIATALAPHDRRAHAGFVGLTGPAVAVNPNTARRTNLENGVVRYSSPRFYLLARASQVNKQQQDYKTFTSFSSK